MEPVGLAVSILTVVDEIYVVARFIYRTVKSAKNADAELDNLMSSMRVELLFLRSFLAYFERARGSITQVADLDEVFLSRQSTSSPYLLNASSCG